MNRPIARYIVLFMAIMLASCRPSSVLSPRQMREVLIDLHRADAILQVAGFNYGHDEAVAKYYQVVLDKHGITQAQFDSSMVWYTDNPQIFDKIYPKVVAALEKEQERWEEQQKLVDERRYRQPRYLMDLDSLKQYYHHGEPNLWLKMEENEEKCKKSDEKFAYIVEIS